jgi:hypothetical protein
MLGRIGSAAIAFGLIAALAGVLAQERIEPALESQPVPEPRQETGAEQGQASADQQEADADRIVPALDAIATTIRDLITEEDAQQRERQEYREVADLHAQQDMAMWAKRMFLAAVASVGLTFIGVILLWGTLKHTRTAALAAVDTVNEARKTTAEATRAANAAFDANEISRKSFIEQQRAWLDLIEIRPLSALTWHNGVGIIELQFNITNVGHSPAVNAMIESRLLLINTRLI